MSNRREIDLQESVELLKGHEKNTEIQVILSSFENGDFANVVKSIMAAKLTYQDNVDMTRVLLLLELTSYLKLEQTVEAKESLRALHTIIPENDYEKLFTLGEMAYQLDLKLARKMMSQLVNTLEADRERSHNILGEAYLLLAEIEETMDKLPRAIKYYEKGMEHLTVESSDQNLFAFLFYKIGILNSALRKDAKAIEAFEKGLALVNQDIENKVHILVSLGKIYMSKRESEEAFPYLTEGLYLIVKTDLKNKLIHAEALTEIAYYYFEKKQVDDALPFYEQALNIYCLDKEVSSQKLGMIYMQYAYCLEHKKSPNIRQASMQYENGLTHLEESGNKELFENALVDAISFFAKTKNNQKKRHYETKLLKLSGSRV